MLSDAEIGRNVDILNGILRKLLTAQEDKEGINDHERLEILPAVSSPDEEKKEGGRWGPHSAKISVANFY